MRLGCLALALAAAAAVAPNSSRWQRSTRSARPDRITTVRHRFVLHGTGAVAGGQSGERIGTQFLVSFVASADDVDVVVDVAGGGDVDDCCC